MTNIKAISINLEHKKGSEQNKMLSLQQLIKLRTYTQNKGNFPELEFKPCGARFSKALETFRARKAIFSVSKIRDVYMPETSCMKGASVHIKNM